MIDRIEKSACTSVMVGKKASLNGSTFIARNEDRLVAIYPKRFLIQPAVSGRKEVYKSTYNKLEVPLPESGYRYSSTPNVTMEDGINEEDGFNEKGVGESATESVYANERVLACDPYNKNGLAEDSMTTLVLPFINSAREGIQYLGKLIAKYGGLKEMGFNSTTAMKSGIWKSQPGITGLPFRFPMTAMPLQPTKSQLKKSTLMIRITLCGLTASKNSLNKIT